MVHKRPFDNEDLSGVRYKQPRQAEQCVQEILFTEHVLLEAASLSSHSSDDEMHQRTTTIKPPNIEACMKYDDITNPMTPDEGIEPCAAGRVSVSSWATSGTTEDDARSSAHFHASNFPEYLSPERPSRRLVHSEDIYSLLLECSPRKPIPVGLNHQADIPEWNVHSSTSNNLIGTCVIPMESPACDSEDIGSGRTDCNCEDMGSTRCVEQHILEAREGLIRTVGHEKFVELGFYDMGEQVSKKWSEDDEHLFHEVVYTNPSSFDTNFWEILFRVFPNRTKKDIVSYYFNVFMLRRRAEQNRRDPNNIDSDNDEGHVCREYDNELGMSCREYDNELDMSEENEDSDVESFGYEDYFPHNQRQKEVDDYDGEVADDIWNDKNLDHGFQMGNDVSETSLWNFQNNCGSYPTIQHQNKILWDQEIQDDSCTSTDSGPTSLVTEAKVSHASKWPESYNVLNNDVEQEDVLGPCDAKIWDTAYMSCPKHVFDFLPTCNMIEEVFGDESWNHKSRDGKDSR